MARNLTIALYLGVLIAVIVSVDVLFLRDRFLDRLIANIGIAAVFVAFYVVVLRKR